VALDVDAVDAAGAWLRHIPHSADPRSRPNPHGDNRWQRGAIVDALYLAGDELTLWAEWYRHLAERGLPRRGSSRAISGASASPRSMSPT